MNNLDIIEGAGFGSLTANTQNSFSPVARSAMWVDRALRIGMASTHHDGSLTVGAKTVLKRPGFNGAKHIMPIAHNGNFIKFSGKIWTFCFVGQAVQDSNRLWPD